MKFIKKLKKKWTIQNSTIVFTLFLIAFFAACSNDDEGNVNAIDAMTQTFTVNGINNCTTSSGSGSTLLFTIPYQAPSEKTISRLLIKTQVSNGETEESINTKFTDEQSTITWASCFHFGSLAWVEYEVRLEAADGSMSNPSKVRVNKPSGAQ